MDDRLTYERMLIVLWSIVNKAGVNNGFVNIDDEAETALRMAIEKLDPYKKVIKWRADTIFFDEFVGLEGGSDDIQ